MNRDQLLALCALLMMFTFASINFLPPLLHQMRMMENLATPATLSFFGAGMVALFRSREG